jgi:hypothetical protein
MKIAISKPLFAWDALEDSPSLQSRRLLLEGILDQPLLESLRQARGNGRDDYRVEVLWGTLLLAIALPHVCTDACLEELKRNRALRLLIGIEAVDRVPDADNMTRFLARLGEEPHLTHLRAVFDGMVRRLGLAVGDLGRDSAGDSTGLAGRAARSEPPGGRTPLKIAYDRAGTVFCYDRVSDLPVRQGMAYIGHEPDRSTIKYLCPARHYGWDGPSDTLCNGQRRYGLTVRVPQEVDLRPFPSIPRAAKQFERLYAGRTAVERVNGRLKIFWGLDDGQVYGARRFHAHVGAVMVVHLAFATLRAQTARCEGTYGTMKLSPIAKALRELVAVSSAGIEQPARA